jgi:hypothetical protein
MATYKTAMGKAVDIDSLRVANENVIAVGNMRTNARGDELGAGGKILKTRAQLMQEYHKLNTPTASHDDVVATSIDTPAKPVTKLVTPTADDTPVVTSTAASVEYTKPRGSFAGAVASETEVKQELLTPLSTPSTAPGVKRI